MVRVLLFACSVFVSAGLCAEARFPIVMAHGHSGFSHDGPFGEYFVGVKADLESRGYRVYTPRLPPYNGSEVRAQYLAKSIDKALKDTGAAKAHVIGHSQGGTDARYLISKLGYGNRVATVTTISTPHRGTPVADSATILPGFVVELAFAIAEPFVRSPWAADVGGTDAARSLRSLTEADAEIRNQELPDDDRVAYFSFATHAGPADEDVCRRAVFNRPNELEATPALWLSAGYYLMRERRESGGANDGVVPTSSMPFGTFLGCLPADHVGVVGMRFPGPENADAHVFDHIAFYRYYAERLRAFEEQGHTALTTVAPPHLGTARRGDMRLASVE